MRAAARGPWIAAWLVGWVMVAGVRAQAAPSEPAPEASRSPDAQTPRPVVLFLLPATDPQTDGQLRDAVLAQFSVVDVRVVLEPAPALAPGVAERMDAMQVRANELGAVAAFSIDERADDRWFVYLFDAQRERLLIRALDASSERRAAAIESVALMARESTRAVLEGEPMPDLADAEPPPPSGEPSPPAPPATPAPVEHKSGVPTLRGPPAAGLRLWLAYNGTNFADEVLPRHAAAVGIGWLGFAPWYAAVSVELEPPIELETDEPEVAFRLQRVPFHGFLGHRYRQDRIVFDLELAVTAELLHRWSDQNQRQGPDVRVTASENDWLAGTGLRARVEYLFVPWAGVAAELGFDALINANGFKYLARSQRSDTNLLRPLPVRPIWSLAVAFYP